MAKGNKTRLPAFGIDMQQREEHGYCPGAYGFLSKMTKKFHEPHNILKDDKVPHAEKKELLEKWREERIRYLYEYGRDSDYLHDKEIEKLEKSLDAIQLAFNENAFAENYTFV